MSSPIIRYRVTYSQRVLDQLRALVVHARGRGMAEQVLDAVKEINRRLEIYPQFGEPIADLQIESGQICIAAVPPLVVQYAIIESERLVSVGVPLKMLPNSGI